MKKLLFAIGFLAAFPGFAQKAKSIKPSDTVAVVFLFDKAWAGADEKLSDSLFPLVLQRSSKLGYKRGLGLGYLLEGRSEMMHSEYNKARQSFVKAQGIFKSVGDHRKYATALSNHAIIGLHNANLDLASSKFFEVIRYGQSHKIPNSFAGAHEGVATVYSRQENFPKTIEYSKKALQLYRDLDRTDKVASIGHLLGLSYYYHNDYKQALVWFRNSVENYRKVGDSVGVAIDYSHIGLIEKDRDYLKGIRIMEKAQLILEPSEFRHNTVNNLGNIGQAYFEVFESDSLQTATGISKALALSKADLTTSKALELAREYEDVQSQLMILDTYAEISYIKGNYRASHKAMKDLQIINDTLYSQENKNKIAELESAQAVALKDKELQINKLELQTRDRQRWLMLALIAFLGVIAGLILWQSRIRRNSNRKLHRLNQELETANAVKTRFFAILNHDLRSPAASVVNYLQLSEMEDVVSPDEKARYRKKIQDSAEFLLETMEDLLLWSKGQMKQFEPHFDQVSILEVFENMGRLFPLATFENPGNLVLETDIDYLKTIIRNLTSNAIKNLDPSRKPEVIWRAGTENGSVVFHLTDNGKGANPDAFEALFDQTVMSSTRSGLGLHLVRDLAQAIRCGISVTTEIGKGTHFILKF